MDNRVIKSLAVGRPEKVGNQKQKWTSEEEEALKAGVAKHGTGKWKTILTDPDFAPSLTHRSNIDLKDKWRNLGISRVNGSLQAARETVSGLAITCAPPSAAAAHNTNTNTTNTNNNTNTAAFLVDRNAAQETSKVPPEGGVTITPKRYQSLIYEALSSIQDSRGSDVNTIANFIEERHEVPPNFRKSLSSHVRKLAFQGKLEKIQKCYKIKDAGLGTRTPPAKLKNGKPGASNSSGSYIPSTLEGSAKIAAYRIADAENKSYAAAEAVREAERVMEILEESELMLEIAKGIWEQCSL